MRRVSLRAAAGIGVVVVVAVVAVVAYVVFAPHWDIERYLFGWPPSAEPVVNTTEHPRLFFTRKNIPSLRSRAASTDSEIWQPILEFAQSQLDSPEPKMPASGDLDGFRNAGNQIIAFAFAYVISGDKAYLDLTRRNLLTYVSWQYWGDENGYGDRDLGFHHMLFGTAIAYDWVYSDLSTRDRDTIGNGIARRAQESYAASTSTSDRWGNWWRRAYTQNHNWINNSALGIAALVLYGEDERARNWLGEAADNLRRDAFVAGKIGDGSWHEGIPYQDYMLSMSLPFLYNLRNLTGLDIIPADYLKGYTLWRVYNWLPGTHAFALNFSDFELDWGSAYGPEDILRFIAAQYGDGRAEWMAEQIVASDTGQASVFTAPWDVFGFLYHDPSVPPKPPADLPLARTFQDLSAVIWRSGWGANSIVFGFKSGPPGGRFLYDAFTKQQYPFEQGKSPALYQVGHDHEDANSFYLYRGRVDLSSETQGVDKADTSYHNSILVDGKGQNRGEFSVTDPGQLRGQDAGISVVGHSANFSYLIGDTSSRYGSQIQESRRYVLFPGSDYLVMVDSLRSYSPHRYEWVAHLGGAASVQGDWVQGGAAGGSLLGIKVVQPSGFSVSTGNDGKEYVRIRPSTDAANARFVMVLYPTDVSQWNQKPEIVSLGDNGQMVGVRVQMNGAQDHLIRYGGDPDSILGDYFLNGRVASVVKGLDGKPQRVFLGQGSVLADGGGARPLIQSPEDISAIEADYEGPVLRLYGRPLKGLKVYAPDVDPAKVTANGESATATKNGDYIVIQ